MRTLLVVSFLCSTLWSQPQISPERPPIAEKSGAKTAQQKTEFREAQQQRSEANATAQNQGKPLQRQDDSSNNAAEELEINRSLATFTMWLVIVGAIQIIALLVQAGILYRTLRDNKRAIELTRKSLILTQRPRLVVRRIVIQEPRYAHRFLSPVTDSLVFEPGAAVSGSVEIVNQGNNTAMVRASYCRVWNTVGGSGSLPREDPYEASRGTELIAPQAIPPGERREGQFRGIGPTSTQVQASPALGTLNLFLIGWIDYKDDLQLIRRTAFCRRYHSELDRFEVVDDPDYEYAD